MEVHRDDTFGTQSKFDSQLSISAADRQHAALARTSWGFIVIGRSFMCTTQFMKVAGKGFVACVTRSLLLALD